MFQYSFCVVSHVLLFVEKQFRTLNCIIDRKSKCCHFMNLMLFNESNMVCCFGVRKSMNTFVWVQCWRRHPLLSTYEMIIMHRHT